MSLLLDALKKAEEAKRLAAAPPAAPANTGSTATLAAASSAEVKELSLEPVSAISSMAVPVSPLPELSAHLDTVDADLAAMPTNPALRKAPSTPPKRSQPPPRADTDAERDAVRNVFAAKRAPAPNRNTLWIALGAVTIAAVGIGTWFWMQLQSVGGNSLATRSPTAGAASYSPPPAAAYTPPPTAPLPPAASALHTAPEMMTEDARPEKQEAPARAAPRPPEHESPVRISRGELRINPTLAKAYDQFQANDLVGAAESYEKALRADPKNTDALLGMAAIAARMGQTNQAENWYVRALEADPKDINAQAGLINLRSQTDPAAAEGRLKGLLAAQPDSASLNFALGNLYAGQRRWPDAQLAYFNAHTADPSNPDYLFNLAASLDHMHMPKIALEYYQSALAATNGRQAGFNTNQVKARILELQR